MSTMLIQTQAQTAGAVRQRGSGTRASCRVGYSAAWHAGLAGWHGSQAAPLVAAALAGGAGGFVAAMGTTAVIRATTTTTTVQQSAATPSARTP